MKELKNMPNRAELLLKQSNQANTNHKVNAHFHTPYSFSAFRDINEVLEMAIKEDVKVLGINDFYSTAGYDEFSNLCVKNKVFPMFNIEFMGLVKEMQMQGIRINDPNNPGRIYFCGKGLDYPVSMSDNAAKMLNQVRSESNRQVEEMISKTNAILKKIDAGFEISRDELLKNYVRDLIRERHIAKLLRIKIYEKVSDDTARRNMLSTIYGDKPSNADLKKEAAVEEEIRGNLLKLGGGAFVPEDENAFLDIDGIKRIILDAGGIPCYPVLLDDKNGNFTDFERDWDRMIDELISRNVFCIELIPGRNSHAIMKDFVQFFRKNNFLITFGTEHNAPTMIPLSVSCRDQELDAEMLKVSYESACVVAAHQYLRSKGEQGYVDANGKATREKMSEYISLGKAVIEEFVR